MRVCTTCGKSQPDEAFIIDSRGYTRKRCRTCLNADARARSARNKNKDGIVPNITTKVCKVCQIEQDKSEFRLRKLQSGNYHYESTCKSCNNSKTRAKCTKEVNRARYLANREAMIANSKRWQQRNQDRDWLAKKKYRLENKEKVALIHKRWRARNPDKVRLYAHNRRLKLRVSELDFDAETILHMRAYQHNKCACCGVAFNDIGYELDHIVPVAKGGQHTVWNLQLLCKSCNSSKNAKDPSTFREFLRKRYPERYIYYCVEQNGLMEAHHQRKMQYSTPTDNTAATYTEEA